MFLNAILKSNKSIRSQATIFLVTGISVMTLVISIVTGAGVNQQSRELMLNNAFQITEGLAKQAVFPLLSGASQNALEAVQQVQGFQSVLATRLLQENHSIFISHGIYPGNIELNSEPLSDSIIQVETDDYWLIKSPVKVIPEITIEGESEFEVEGDADRQKVQTIGYAEVVYSKENLRQSQQRVAIIITSIGIISVVLLTAILNFALVKLFYPLEQLALTMQKAKASGEHLFADIDGAKEIRKIAKYYNSMMAVLNEQDEALKSHRDRLEKQVNIRTQELILARDAALIASRHKSEFMANMSHELRTPIQSIIGYGELVTEELELDGNFSLIEDMDKISRNSQRLLSMINSLLDLAKIEAGRTELFPSEINLQDLQVNLLDTIEPLAQKNNNSFIINQQTTIARLIADKEKLEQVLLNLLSNACKFTEQGQISLTLYNDHQSIYFEIKDTGIGLSAEQQSYIFDEFRQVDSSQSRKFSGTGLGLAISKRFIELMQGSIRVTSELGQGALFTVTLPLNQELSIEFFSK